MHLRNYLPIMTLFFVSYTARGISTPVIPLYLSSLHLSVVIIGVTFAVYGLSILLFEILWGYVLDRIGATKTISLVTVVTVIPFLLFPLAGTAETAIAVQFLYGISAPAMTVVARALIVEESSVSEWGGGFGLVGAILSIAFFVGSLIGGGLASSFGLTNSFYFCAALTLASYVFYRTIKRTASFPTEKMLDPAVRVTSGGDALDRFSLSLLGAVTVPIFMAQAFYTSIMPIAVTTLPEISGTAVEAAVMIALLYLSLAIFQPLIGSLGAGRAKLLITVGLAANMLVFLLLPHANSIVEIGALAFLDGVCFSIVSPLSLSLLMLRTPKRRVGAAMGIYGAAEDVGLILGPLLGGVAWAQFGIEGAYLLLASSFAAMIAVFTYLQRRL
ncbi:MAG: MFS transporter [Thaumarchaeota archaeon]|nr:MFS transporter [Nitrososphaerota archaeon]